MIPRIALIVPLLAACKKEGTPQGPIDVQIDAADGDVDSTQTRMCADGDDVAVVWIDDRDDAPQVWFARSHDGGLGWRANDVQALSTGGIEAFAPDIACGDGKVVVAWEDARDGELENHDIYVRASDDAGATWGDETPIDDDPDGDHMSLGPDVALRGDDVYVAWSDALYGAYDILVAASHDGGATFAGPVIAEADSPGSAYSANPDIAAGPNGSAFVTWEDSRDGNSDVYFAKTGDGGETFDDEIRMDSGENAGRSNSFAPRIAAGDGRVYVVWHDERDGEGRSVYVNASTDGGDTFGDAQRVETDPAGATDSLYPVVAVTTGGVGHIAWQDARIAGFDIWYRRIDGADLSETDQRLDTDREGEANSLFPVIATNEDAIAVAWQDRRDDLQGQGYDDLYYNFSTDAGATWGGTDLRVDRVQSGSKFAVDVNISINGGKLLCAWTDGRNGSADVFFHTMPLGDESPPVVGSE